MLNDAGVAALELIGDRKELAGALAETSAGRQLEAIDRAEDIAFCARVDRTDLVPRFRDRKITVE